MLTFQQIILKLQNYWADQGCALLQPYDMEVGAGTSHTATFLRALGAGEVKFTGEVGPDVKLVRYEIDIKRLIKRKLNMAIGDARLLADGKEIYVANDLRVGLFLRPGEGQESSA